jgi:RNA polymerase sigma-70 factor (ECF subfamily)
VATLVREHWDLVHRSAYLIVQDAAAAEDVAQETMLAAIRGLDRFDDSRPLRPWLNRIAVNNALKWLRSPARREVGREDAMLDGHPAREQTAELSDEMLRALAALDPEQRAVVVLRYLIELTPGEIANALSLPRGTVNSRLRRALDRLGDALGEGVRG